MTELERLIDITKQSLDLQFQCIKLGDFSSVNDLLENILRTLTSRNMIDVALVLRATYVNKNQLPAWDGLLYRAVEMAKMQGINTNDMFYGLLSHK